MNLLRYLRLIPRVIRCDTFALITFNDHGKTLDATIKHYGDKNRLASILRILADKLNPIL